MPSRIKVRHNGGKRPAMAIGIGFADPADLVTTANLGVPLPSSAAVQVQNVALNTSTLVIEGRPFQAGQAITFDLLAPNALGATEQSREEYVDFPYTSNAGVIDAVRVNVLVQRADDAAAVDLEVVNVIAPTTTLFTAGDKAKLNHLTVTQAVDLDDMEADIASALATLATMDSEVVIDPRDFGAVAGDSVTEQQALDNADALVAAFDEAYAQGFSMSVGAGASGNLLGGSFNRRPTAEVRIEGLYRIAKPLWIKQQAGNLNWKGYNGAIARYGAEDYFRTNYPGRWAIEVGDDLTVNTTAYYVAIRGLTFTGFDRLMQLGYAPNNLNGGLMAFWDCHFVGPTNVGHPNTYGIRTFNRSSILSFDRCVWNQFTRGLEIQSVDRVFLNDCRIQLGNEVFVSDTPRPDKEAQIVLRHGRLRINGLIGNPPLRYAADLSRDELKAWVAGESLVKGAYRKLSGVAYRTKRALTTQATVGAEDVSGSSADWETIPAEASGIANIDTQRYFWAKTEDVPAWAANSEYAKGDLVLQPYDTGGNACYWSRLNYTADCGSSWTTDRTNWQCVDSMRDWVKSTAVVTNDVRRARDPADNRAKFWRSNSSRTTGGGTFDATEKANWTLVTNSGASGTSYGTAPFTVYRVADQPISAWHVLGITGQTLAGAESGGLTPVYWNVPKMPQYAAGVEERKQHTALYIVGNTLQSDRRYPHEDLNATNDITAQTLRPAVLLADLPNHTVIRDNCFSKSAHVVAAAWDPYLAKKPYVPVNNEANWSTHWDFLVEGNLHIGSAGIAWFGANHTPHPNTYRLYSPNWAPEELLSQLLAPVWISSASSLSSVTAWAASAVVRNGEHRRATDPADSVEKLWRSRYHRTTGASFNAAEAAYWQLVDDITTHATPQIAPTIGAGDFFRMDQPVAANVVSFNRATPGKVFWVGFANGNCTLKHSASVMVLIGAADKLVPAGGIVGFVVQDGVVRELSRNFT